MSSTISARVERKLTVTETVSGDFIDESDTTITFSGLNRTEVVAADTDVPATKHTAFRQALTDGAATINLAALVGAINANETVVGTGLKVQFIILAAPATNANAIAISEGASNGYALLGASFTFALLPGQWAMFGLNEAAPDVASDDRTIDLAGTGTQALDIQLVLG